MMFLAAFVLAAPAAAQFGGFFDQFFGNQQQQFQQQQHPQENEQVNNPVENTYLNGECDAYLCEDTLTCVNSPNDCPCVFPESQIKCMLPGDQGYVCISRPSNDEGPSCAFVAEAAQGLL